MSEWASQAVANPDPLRSREELLRKCVGRLGDGSEDALATIYDQTSTLVYSIALGILGDRADAEEVTLDVYSQVWRGAGTFSPERGSVVAWLVMIARSRSIDRLRSGRRRNEQEVDGLPGDIGEKPAAGQSPEDATLAGEQTRRVRTALAELPANQRQLIELACYRGYTHSELSERLGLPLGTVKTRMRVGLARLRELLSEPGRIAH